ncbi:hypothetical protein J8J27_24210, partial [Mycobacterium tuberculosis]|nr:hypothetical protein [Mycobacterium tuberculosis]
MAGDGAADDQRIIGQCNLLLRRQRHAGMGGGELLPMQRCLLVDEQAVAGDVGQGGETAAPVECAGRGDEHD